MKILISYIPILILVCCLSMFSCNAIHNELVDAVRMGDVAAVRQALNSSLDYDDILAPEEFKMQLFLAVDNGNLAAMQQAVAHGVNIHTVVDELLRIAAFKGDVRIVKFLIDQGANIHALDQLALREAAYCGHWAVVACLLQHGADITKLTPTQLEALHNSVPAQEYITAEIHSAVARNDLEEVKKLLAIIPVHQYVGAKIYIALQRRNLGELQELLNVLPFDYLPEYTQIQIREFTQQRALHGPTKKRKTKCA